MSLIDKNIIALSLNLWYILKLRDIININYKPRRLRIHAPH